MPHGLQNRAAGPGFRDMMSVMEEPTQISSRPQACGTCRFWKRAAGGDLQAGWGQCRRHRPTVPEVNDDKLVHVGVWPHTDVTDWCGEWEEA